MHNYTYRHKNDKAQAHQATPVNTPMRQSNEKGEPPISSDKNQRNKSRTKEKFRYQVGKIRKYRIRNRLPVNNLHEVQ